MYKHTLVKSKKEVVIAMINVALNIVYSYLMKITPKKNHNKVILILNNLTGKNINYETMKVGSYNDVQDVLSNINEKESIRKSKGVYYTPSDVVNFIVKSSIKLMDGELCPENISVLDVEHKHYSAFCKKKTAFDPTCGAGEFLLAMLIEKLNIWDNNSKRTTSKDIETIIETIYGNDENEDSVIITKMRLFLEIVERYGVEKCINVPIILNSNFTTNEYVNNPSFNNKMFDIIIGNPPYVEDSKSGLNLNKRYGNIYANILVNAAERLEKGGVFGFIIPISYVSTPRMKKLRDDLYKIVPIQYILSYSDRPDCLFNSVHQKLCILIYKNVQGEINIFTSNYQYWYKNEREMLFERTRVIKNAFIRDSYIPKLGNELDVSIFSKIGFKEGRKSILEKVMHTGEIVYLNMRAAFWIKSFMKKHKGSEYKEYRFKDNGEAEFMMCLWNSSLFWWYWVVVSDCWHITRKELNDFFVPNIENYEVAIKLAHELEMKLEKTKKYVGTVQTDYEYKHKYCIDEIHRIDDYIHEIYGLSEEESNYIKKFANAYRVSGGTVNESN